jgi:hypothetical protein
MTVAIRVIFNIIARFSITTVEVRVHPANELCLYDYLIKEISIKKVNCSLLVGRLAPLSLC